MKIKLLQLREQQQKAEIKRKESSKKKRLNQKTEQKSKGQIVLPQI
jgi:hypothetical protein